MNIQTITFKDIILLETTVIPYIHLPNEILAQIFSYLPIEGGHWFSIMLSCKRFLQIGKEVFSPAVNNNVVIRMASEYGRYNIVKRLLKDPRVDPSVNLNWCIRIASMSGYHKVVKYLLRHPKVNPAVLDNICIRYAAANGYWKVVRLLIRDRRVDPTAMNSECIREARSRKHWRVLSQLLKDERIQRIENDTILLCDT